MVKDLNSDLTNMADEDHSTLGGRTGFHNDDALQPGQMASACAGNVDGSAQSSATSAPQCDHDKLNLPGQVEDPSQRQQQPPPGFVSTFRPLTHNDLTVIEDSIANKVMKGIETRVL